MTVSEMVLKTRAAKANIAVDTGVKMSAAKVLTATVAWFGGCDVTNGTALWLLSGSRIAVMYLGIAKSVERKNIAPDTVEVWRGEGTNRALRRTANKSRKQEDACMNSGAANSEIKECRDDQA
jgi:hypothetical protein